MLSRVEIEEGDHAVGTTAGHAVAEHADGVVIGSAIVRTMGASDDDQERLQRIDEQVGAFRAALDTA